MPGIISEIEGRLAAAEADIAALKAGGTPPAAPDLTALTARVAELERQMAELAPDEVEPKTT